MLHRIAGSTFKTFNQTREIIIFLICGGMPKNSTPILFSHQQKGTLTINGQTFPVVIDYNTNLHERMSAFKEFLMFGGLNFSANDGL